MAITIDYSDRVTPEYVINIPRADLTLVQSVPTEVRQLNIDAFRIELMDLQDDEEGQPFPITHVHTPPLTISGVTLARVVEILEPYVLQFEDGLYNVNIIGGNSNISDVTLKNQVGINTANSAGLQDPFALQAASFAGEVTIDAVGGTSGTAFPIGTRNFPSNNLADTLTIAEARGLRTIHVVGALTLGSSDFSDGYIFKGDSLITTDITIAAGANVMNCTFETAHVDGTLDGNNTFVGCSVGVVTVFNGTIISSGVAGDIVLGGDGSALAELIDCWSEVAGGEAGQLPYIDLGGSDSSDLLVRDWHGGLGIKNGTANRDCSIDMSSGRVIFDATVTDGTYIVRGIAEVTDNSTGTAVVNDRTLSLTTITNDVWDEDLTTHNVADSASIKLQEARIAADRAGTQRLE